MNAPRRAPGIHFGDVVYAPAGEFGPRLQKDYQLVIVHLGSADVSFGGQRCVVLPGSVALFLPGRWEHFLFARKHRTHHSWCAVSPDRVPPALRKRLARLAPVLPQSQAFQHLMKASFSLRTARSSGDRHMLGVLGVALLEEYVRMDDSGADETNRDGPCARARHYLEEHYAEDDCLKHAARAAGVTPQHLVRLFRKTLQQTPGRYLWQLRIERGAELLTATGLTVAEIADQCGFANPFHFSRLLRRMQGVSPRELRRQSTGESRSEGQTP